MAGEPPEHTLQPTALVHEAYLRLVGRGDDLRWDVHGHFFAAAAEAMCRILIEAARRKHGVRFRDRLFNPVITIWGFLSQALSDDHSSRDPVARILAHRAASSAATRRVSASPLRPVSSAPGAGLRAQADRPGSISLPS